MQKVKISPLADRFPPDEWKSYRFLELTEEYIPKMYRNRN